MTNTRLEIQEDVSIIEIREDVSVIELASVGLQGPPGPPGASGSVGSLSDLEDVAITGPISSGAFLSYNSSAQTWQNVNIIDGGTP